MRRSLRGTGIGSSFRFLPASANQSKNQGDAACLNGIAFALA
jgi:hypothetical protein